MTPEQRATRVRKLVSTAKALLTLQVGFFVGARRIQNVLQTFGAEFDTKHKIFSEFTNAVPKDIPLGSARLLWDTEVMLNTELTLALWKNAFAQNSWPNALRSFGCTTNLDRWLQSARIGHSYIDSERSPTVSVAKSVFLSGVILFAPIAGWAQSADLVKCGQGSANGQFECLDPQFQRELARKADTIQKLKKLRQDVSMELDQIAVAETEYRENFCALVGALEEGEPRWRSVWGRQCELKELHRFNDSLSRYSK